GVARLRPPLGQAGIQAWPAPPRSSRTLEFCGADDLLTKVRNQLHLTVIAVGRQNPMMSPLQVFKHRELAAARPQRSAELAPASWGVLPVRPISGRLVCCPSLTRAVRC